MADQTLEQLQERARELDVSGRSKMTADELATAIGEAERALERERAAEAAQAPDGPYDLTPATPEETGRPDLAEVAQERAANRNPRVIGADQD